MIKSGNLILLGGFIFLVFIFSLFAVFMRQNLTFVTKDYYSQELRFDQKKQAVKNALLLDTLISYHISDSQIYISIPTVLSNQLQEGTVQLYCPADDQKDQILALQPNSTGIYLVPVLPGVSCPYILKLYLVANHTEFYREWSL